MQMLQRIKKIIHINLLFQLKELLLKIYPDGSNVNLKNYRGNTLLIYKKQSISYQT